MSRLLRLCLTVALILVPTLAGAKTDSFSVHTGVNATEGKYGTDTTTTYISLPLALKYYATPRLTLGLTIHYVYQRNGTLVNGVVVPRRVGRGSSSGLGDIVLLGDYLLLNQTQSAPSLSVFSSLKLPTADSSRGLGTGEADFAGGVSLRKDFGRNAVYGYTGYTVVGKPAGVVLRNFLSFGVGFSRLVTAKLAPYVELNGATRVSGATSSILSATLGFDYSLTRSVSVGAYALKGLTSGAPDFGGGATLGFYF